MERQTRGSALSTKGLWKSGRGKAGKLAVGLWRWAAEELQVSLCKSIHIAGHHWRGKEEGNSSFNRRCKRGQTLWAECRLINSGWIAWARVSDLLNDPKHPVAPGQITDKVSQRIQRM